MVANIFFFPFFGKLYFDHLQSRYSQGIGDRYWDHLVLKLFKIVVITNLKELLAQFLLKQTQLDPCRRIQSALGTTSPPLSTTPFDRAEALSVNSELIAWHCKRWDPLSYDEC